MSSEIQPAHQPRPLTRKERRHANGFRMRDAWRSRRPKAAHSSRARPLVASALAVALMCPLALPAYAASPVVTELTLQQAGAGDSQEFTASRALPAFPLDRQSYAATSQEEIEQKKAKEAAAAAAAAARAAGAARPATTSATGRAVPVLATGSGVVRWPLTSTFNVTDRFGARGGAHMGTDMVTAGGTPIYASVAGTVGISSESYGAYGVAVTVDSVVNGQRIRAVYPHMQYNSRQVGSGQQVQAGQLLGLVGSTGRSTANHLHFEVSVNDVTVDSLAWLEANAQ